MVRAGDLIQQTSCPRCARMTLLDISGQRQERTFTCFFHRYGNAIAFSSMNAATSFACRSDAVLGELIDTPDFPVRAMLARWLESTQRGGKSEHIEDREFSPTMRGMCWKRRIDLRSRPDSVSPIGIGQVCFSKNEYQRRNRMR